MRLNLKHRDGLRTNKNIFGDRLYDALLLPLKTITWAQFLEVNGNTADMYYKLKLILHGYM